MEQSMHTINIAVIALPDGTVIHCEDHPSILQKKIDKWKETIPTKRLQDLEHFTYGGVVKIRMLKRDWNKIK